MMEVYFLRHGKAVELGDAGATNDFGRPLTKQGLEELEAEARTLVRLGVRIDALLTSPLVRAKQTADIVARALGLKRELIVEDLLRPRCTLDRLRQLLDVHGQADSVMLVGHEPDFSQLVGELIGPSGAAIEMKKGGLALVRIDRPVRSGHGRLRWLATPKLLRLCVEQSADDE